MAIVIIPQIDAVRADLLHKLARFTEDQFNTAPFDGSWTPGQVAEHVLLSVSGGLAVIRGAVNSTGRNPAEQVEPLRSLFLNFEIKMKGPDFVQPTDKPKDKAALTATLRHTWEEIAVFAANHDLHLLCSQFEMPSFGALTRLEWLWFMIFHTQRHIYQLKNMLPFFSESGNH